MVLLTTDLPVEAAGGVPARALNEMDQRRGSRRRRHVTAARPYRHPFAGGDDGNPAKPGRPRPRGPTETVLMLQLAGDANGGLLQTGDVAHPERQPAGQRSI